jgi:glycosyltransferase involved in cell wall biosynthesis
LGADKLVFAGWRDDVPELLCLFDLFVSSSIEEGLGTSVMQALASGTPAVVTDAGGLPEVVDDGGTGLVVPAGDAAALAGAVVRLLNDGGLRATMCDAACRTARARFAPERMVEGTLAVYREVLARS